MASKKFYAVKRGKTTGVFESWEECRISVEGYPGAQYKGFSTREEANAYLNGNCAARVRRGVGENGAEKKSAGCRKNAGKSAAQARTDAEKDDAQGVGEIPPEGELLAYVDGSYDNSKKKYAFGCVFLLPDGRIYTEYGNGDDEQSLRHRNVTGEMLGAMYAVKFAMINGFSGIEIRYDYQGIEKWVTGEWRSKTELTQKYAEAMRGWGKDISLCFTKVAAHTNVKYNELADRMAKKGITQGNGVPRVKRIEDMEEYHGTDQTE